MNASYLMFSILTVLLLTSPLSAQEDKVVIISRRVGMVIDREERERFHLFQQINDFVMATVFVTQKDSFYIRFRTGMSGSVSDTVISYSKSTILYLSEKIDHMEGIIEGKYTMGSIPARIYIDDGRLFARDSISRRLQLPAYPWLRSDILPFTGGPTVKDEIPRFYFGVGWTTYSPDFDGLRKAFVVTANQYRVRVLTNQGFIAKKPALDFSPLMRFTFSLKVAKEWTISTEASKTQEGDDIFKAFSFSLNYYPSSWGTEFLHPFVGGGFGPYYVSTTVKYHIPIDSIHQNLDGSSTIRYFEKIDAQGGAIGFLFTGGCDVDLGSYLNLQATIKYLYVPELQTVLSGNIPASLFLGSIMFGAQCQIVL
ncbi:MAG: hypothetical protein ACOYNS_07050 [Bacteroidota bacterium]